MIRRRWLILVALALIGLGIWLAIQPKAPRIPELFAQDVPDDCRQVMLVLSPEDTSFEAELWLMERDPDLSWHAIEGPLPVTVGRRGLAWGKGEHTAEPPDGFRLKREGDKCSPAGVFRVPFAFGIPPPVEADWLRLPYVHLTEDIIGVDDPKSRHYNQVLDASKVARDWDSDERMNRHQKVYRWGAFIAHNPNAVPHAGSCIFLHLWTDPGRSTAGCTAMSETHIVRVLEWLDPAMNPRLVQGLDSW